MKSKTFFKAFEQLLPHSELNARLARLAVHYEDLQLEACGIAALDLHDLDFRGLEFRHLYFIRRVVATLYEFTCALTHLNQSPEFGMLKKRLRPNELIDWNTAMAFFDTHKETFKNTRDDVSAHFQSRVTDYSTQNIDPTSIAKIELVKGSNGKFAIKFRFVDELIATALTARRGKQAPDKFINHLVKLTREGCRQAVVPATVIHNYLLESIDV